MLPPSCPLPKQPPSRNLDDARKANERKQIHKNGHTFQATLAQQHASKLNTALAHNHHQPHHPSLVEKPIKFRVEQNTSQNDKLQKSEQTAMVSIRNSLSAKLGTYA